MTLKIPKYRYEEIEKKVVDLYKRHGIHNIPIDPFKILENSGFVLIPFSKFDDNNRPKEVNDKNDAFSFYSPKHKTHFIIYNDNKPLPRIRFTLMHELGHIVLGHKGESDLARREADYFAGYSLAPTPLISAYASEDIYNLSSTFWISKDCAEVRSSCYKNWLQYEKYLKVHEIELINFF